MRSFFGHGITVWDQDHDSLHVYALPSPEAVEVWSAYDDLLDAEPAVARQPRAFLHATVQRLPWFRDRLDPADLARLSDALASRIAAVPPFSLSFGRPRTDEYGVVLAARPDAGWDALVAAVRAASVETLGPGPVDPFFGPHVSLAYAVGDGDGDALQARLDAVDLPPVSFTVAEAHLLAVHLRAERGCFEWDGVATYPLDR